MNKREEYVVEVMESTIGTMLKTKGEVNIDVIEKRFEDGCAKCRMYKECSKCAIQAKFIEILNNY